ncbi:MAG: hypothetical protein Q9227_002604 [Pyrenula ochraceoflavens]
MGRLREIPRTAAFTWSAGASTPLIATGTKSGAVTADFSSDTCLELWDLALDNQQQGAELKPSAKFETDAGFHDLAWTQFDESNPRGVIAGGLENGSLNLWDAQKLLESSRITEAKRHSGAIKALQFNPRHRNLLATGGAKGELFVTDLNNVDQPVRLGSTAARSDDIDCLDWNKKVAHIMVTGSSGGFVTVWDMKTKKETLTLNNLGRKAVSAVAWDPDKPTKLVTATPLEQDPVVLVWDLRNSNAPEKTLRAHDSGVLSLSWCAQDADLLLSCGKDNRTVLWNPQTGLAYGDYPVVTNWTFQTRWNPHNPNLFATASFDGKIAVQTLQNTGSDKSDSGAVQNQALDGEDFFSKAQAQPQAASFSLPKAPKWLERPNSVSFGFGGSVVSVRQSEPSKSVVTISKYEVDSSLGNSTEEFEKALQEDNLTNLCESRIAEAKSDEEKADWKVIETLVSGNRKSLLDYLGFSNETDEAADGIANLAVSEDKAKDDDQAATQVNGTNKHKRISSMFDTSADGDFLSDLASSKGATTNSPFQIYTGSESDSDRRITRALMLGDFEKALDVCLQEDRMSDAFMFAICGGQASIAKAQEAYFAKQSGGPNYLRLLASVVGKNLWDTVHNAELSNWKEIMATLCSFADEKEFPDLCEALGDRIEEQVKSKSSAVTRKDASFCFLAGSKLEKVVAIWLEELEDSEAATTATESEGSAFSIHIQALQHLIEKVTVFRKVTKFEDLELRDTMKTSDWKLDSLYRKYVEYADIIAAHGQLQLAEKYLDLLPAKYPDADVARSRVQQATKKAAPAPTSTTQPAPVSRSKPLPSMNSFQPQPSTYSPMDQPTSNAYAPPSVSQPANPYAPPAGYQPTPSMGYQPSQPPRGPGLTAPPPQNYGPPSGRGPIAPPPRSFNQSPSIPPPSQEKNMSNWNDLPEGFGKAPTSRRGTPGAGNNQPVPTPFSGQPPMGSQGPQPPPPGPYGARQKSTPPLPPPPKGPARVSSPLTGGQLPERPPSSATNAYAPSPSVSTPSAGPQPFHPPPVQRTASPYNVPPSTAPPTNRYAPNPSAQASAPPGPPQGFPPGHSQGPPQSRQRVAPAPQYQASPAPPNPYAPSRPAAAPSPSPYTPTAPPQQAGQMPSQPPPPQAGPPPIGNPPSSRPGTGQSEKRRAPAQSKYPSGDRTHIPPSALPIYEILSSEMSRVKSRAPSQYAAQVRDTEKRLNILFDHLNNEDLLKPNTVGEIVELAESLKNKDFERAGQIQMDVFREKVDECGNWMVGVKRLVGMAKATP